MICGRKLRRMEEGCAGKTDNPGLAAELAAVGMRLKVEQEAAARRAKVEWMTEWAEAEGWWQRRERARRNKEVRARRMEKEAAIRREEEEQWRKMRWWDTRGGSWLCNSSGPRRPDHNSSSCHSGEHLARAATVRVDDALTAAAPQFRRAPCPKAWLQQLGARASLPQPQPGTTRASPQQRRIRPSPHGLQQFGQTGTARSPVAEIVRAAHNDRRGPTYASTTADLNRRSCHTDVPLPNERRLYNDLSGDVRPISFCYSTFAWSTLVLH